jgi:hypothetical protein
MSAAPEAIFGQLVIGPPGSGKTTYCKKMKEILESIERPVALINIDPSNEFIPYAPDIDITSLVKTEDVMESMTLGPNGGLLYSMEFLEQNLDWLIREINKLKFDDKKFASSSKKGMKTPYLIFDCPGQIELYTHSESFNKIVKRLSSKKECGLDMRLVGVYLVDSHYTNDSGKFVSSLMSTLSAMMHLELPHVSVLSKVDLMPKNSRFGLGYYCEVMDLSFLIDDLVDDPALKKYKALSKAIADTIESYSLVSYVPLNVNDNRTVLRLIRLIDKANGFHLLDMDTEEAIARIFTGYDSADFEYSKFGPLGEDRVTELEAEDL